MQVPDDATRRGCEGPGDDQDEATRGLAGRILLAVIPSIRAYERERIAGAVPPDDLERIACMVQGRAPARQLNLLARVLRAESPAAMPEEQPA